MESPPAAVHHGAPTPPPSLGYPLRPPLGLYTTVGDIHIGKMGASPTTAPIDVGAMGRFLRDACPHTREPLVQIHTCMHGHTNISIKSLVPGIAASKT